MKIEFVEQLVAKKSGRNEVSEWVSRGAKKSQKAKRSAYSIPNHYHLRLMDVDDMRHWQEALKDYLVARVHITRN